MVTRIIVLIGTRSFNTARGRGKILTDRYRGDILAARLANRGGAVFKVVYLVEKLAGMSDAAFVEHWTTTHAGLAQTMPGLRAYSINHPSSEQRGVRPIDGYA